MAMKDNAQLLPRGIACIVIGLVVLLAPNFLQSPAYQEMFAGAYLVGWFAIVLGVALIVVGLVKRGKGR
ncbi:hypothetical protein WKW80_19450 [Variovorax humicola]|uniref:Uncharacterized protein n=1 Tax=Variovorax humicola TaxID=1769758 RepID=A0ABU8W4M5_9BURK